MEFDDETIAKILDLVSSPGIDLYLPRKLETVVSVLFSRKTRRLVTLEELIKAKENDPKIFEAEKLIFEKLQKRHVRFCNIYHI